MIDKNYHTHMKYCNHAIGDVRDYVLFAKEHGYVELGMSDHAPIPPDSMTKEEWDYNYCGENMTLDTFEIYLKDIEKCQKEFDGIIVYKALESEYLSDFKDFYKSLRERLDYMIFGVHFFKYNNKIISTYDGVNYDNVLGYLEAAKEGMESGLFEYLAHPDLFYFEYKDKNGNHTFDDRCELVTRKIIECAIKNDVYIEINANGLKFSKDVNDNKNYRYPVYQFWNIAKEYKDLKVIIGADAHDPKLLDSEWIRKVIEFADELGIKLQDRLVLNK